MTRARILVTRSEPGASETADRLIARNLDPIVEPVFAVEPIAADLPPFDALAFTSANGVREFARRNTIRNVSAWCIGARTADAARAAGFSDVYSAAGDVAALSSLIASRLPTHALLLHVGNEESRGDLTGQLRARDHAAEFIAIYRAIPASRPGPMLAQHLAGMPAFEAMLVHSPRGAAILAGFIREAASPAPLIIASISPAAAEPLRDLAQITVAAAPNEAALLEALEQLAFFD